MGIIDELFKGKKKPALKKTKSFVVHTEQVGSSGTEIYDGYLQEDYFENLRGSKKADEYDKMRRGDYQVKMVLSAVKNIIKSGVPEIIPASQEPEDLEAAAVVEHILFESMETSFSRFLREGLTFCEFGYSLFEVVHKPFIGVPIVDKDGKEILGSYMGLETIAWRSPRTIEAWRLDPKTNKLKTVEQQAFGDPGDVVEMDAKHLILMNIDQEGDNFEGISLLRPCYGPWFRKNNYFKINAVGIEKFAVPTPIVKVPTGKFDSNIFNRIINIIKNYVTHQNNFVTVPDGYDIELNNNNYDPSKVENSIDKEDARIAKAFLANFLNLDGGGGSNALSNDLSDFFYSGISYIISEFCQPVNKQLIPSLVKMNLGERARYPKLAITGVTDRAGEELAKVLDLLAKNKIVIPDDELEDQVRKRYGLTVKSEEGQREVGAPAPTGEPLTLSEKIENAIAAKRVKLGE